MYLASLDLSVVVASREVSTTSQRLSQVEGCCVGRSHSYSITLNVNLPQVLWKGFTTSMVWIWQRERTCHASGLDNCWVAHSKVVTLQTHACYTM